MILRSAESADVVLEDRVSERAMQELGELDWTRLTTGRLLWDEDEHQWLWIPESSSTTAQIAPRRA
ncbi:MAG: hypothetical protein QOH57_1612 [Mycobacterium sp.]|nr:hypothetical protein [Mycobacterium sp.]